MKKMIFFLLTAILSGILSCSKTESDPKVTCHVKEYKDGAYWQEYTESNITCKECEAKNRNYTEPDFEFPNITYHIVDVAQCEPQ